MNNTTDNPYEPSHLMEQEDSQDTLGSQESTISTRTNVTLLTEAEADFYYTEHPRLTTVVNSLRSGDELHWLPASQDTTSPNHGKRQMKRKRDAVAKCLMVHSGCDRNVADRILTEIRRDILPDNPSSTRSVDTSMIEGIRTSVASLSGRSELTGKCKPGTRQIADQKMLLTVSSAISSGMRKNGIAFTKKHSTRLGVCRKVADKVSKITRDEFNTGKSLVQCIDSAAERETRKDCVRQFAHIYVDKYCHNDINSHRVDSNEKKVKVKKDAETGKPVFHPRRVWEGPVTIEQKHNDFLQSDEYKEFQRDHPTLRIGEKIFLENVCKCLKDAKEHSCVDQIISAVDEYLRAIKEAVSASSTIRHKLSNCQCRHHQEMRESGIMPIEELVFSLNAREMIELTCCSAVKDPYLSCGVGCKHVTPSFIPWDCVEDSESGVPKCESCGVSKGILGIDTCPAYTGTDTEQQHATEFGCMVWEYCQIENCEQKQWELRKKMLSFNEILLGLKNALIEARKHYVDYQWSGHALKRFMEEIDPKKACAIFTDFSATVNLEALKRENSSVPKHAVLDIFLVYDGHRIINVNNQDIGPEQSANLKEELLVHCAAHHFIGDTKSKGKSNNYAFHTDCLLHILREKESKRKPNDDGVFDEFVYYVVSDNCAAQYKCRQNFFFVASVCAREFAARNVRLEHVFATKYRFKGNWDGEGKVLKAMLKYLEKRNIRSPDALSAVINLKKAIERKMSLEELETMIQSGDLTKAAITKMIATSYINERTVYYVTSSEEEFQELSFGGDIDSKFLVYVERDASKRDDSNVVQGTNSSFQFRGKAESSGKKDRMGNDVYDLISSKKVCACDICLEGKSDQCNYLKRHGGIQLHRLRKKIKKN